MRKLSRKGYNSNNIRGKLRVYNYLTNDRLVKPYLPITKAFNEFNLRMMLNQFSTVYIKPDIGSQGFGIYRISRTKNGYLVKSLKGKRLFKNTSLIVKNLSSSSKRNLIIQQGISLEKVLGRPYDIRAMVQRKPHGNWKVTGIFAKVGKADKIVTNYFQGGILVTMDEVYRKMGFDDEEIRKRLEILERVSLQVAEDLSSYKKNMYEMGVDFAFDINKDLWIIEVNSRQPQFYPLKDIDKEMYNLMLEYARSYGRKNGY